MRMASGKRVKIVRDESIGNKQWNSTNVNEWVDSTMQVYLNDIYNFDILSKKMIGKSKWYLGGRGNNSANGDIFYSSERSETVYNVDRSTNWIGFVGLMYPSDYIYTYALRVDDVCYNTPISCRTDAGAYPSLGWLYRSGYNQWTMSSRSSNTNSVFYIHSAGLVNFISANNSNGNGSLTVYLDRDVKITSGDGTIDNAYKLSM